MGPSAKFVSPNSSLISKKKREGVNNFCRDLCFLVEGVYWKIEGVCSVWYSIAIKASLKLFKDAHKVELLKTCPFVIYNLRMMFQYSLCFCSLECCSKYLI